MRRRTNDGELDPRPGGNMPELPIEERSKASIFVGRIIRTIVVVALFLYVCKITHFRQKVLYDVRINRNFLKMFYMFTAIYIGCYLYMFFKMSVFRRPKIPVEKWDAIMPIPFYAMTICLVLMVICFIFAMWRTFQLMTFVIGALGFLSVVFVIQWIPI